jgi:ribonuclease P protein component
MLAVFSICKQSDFDYISKHGQKKHSKYFTLLISTNSDQLSFVSVHDGNYIAFGMKVSKRFAPKAVVRNRFKRKIRHIIRNIASELSPSPFNNLAIIIIPKTQAHQARFAEMNLDLKKLIHYLQKI